MKSSILFRVFLLIFFFSFLIIIPLLNAQKTKIKTENGVTVVYNSKNPSPKNGLRMRIVFEEELSIGEIEGDENYMFSGQIFFNTDREGNFYVADMEADEEFSGPVFTDDLKKIAIKQIKYPKYKPAYQSFSLMENGWLAVSVDSVENEYTLFDIFDQEGKYIAHFKTTELTLPAEGIVSEFFFFFKNGKAYAVATEDDYRFVKRYNFEIQEYKDNKWVKK